ncbi:MAG: hypothetical protein ACJASX_001424 [Limisphaerales bacterium]|jgi:hypothetical protein
MIENPEFADPGAPEPAIAAWLAGWGSDQMRKVGTAVRRHRGSGALEGTQA